MAGAQPWSTDGAQADAAEADFGQAHAELLADRSIQFELPPAEGTRVEVPGEASQQTPLPRATRPPSAETETRPVVETPQIIPSAPPAPVDPGPLALGIFWVIVGLIAAGLLYLIVSRLAGWRLGGRDRAASGAAEEAEWRIGEAPARQMLDEADVLAADGRYSEAAHLLLHRSIAEIDRRRPATVRKALTSRDIAALPSLPPSPRSAFAAIVRAVERSLFGRRPLDEPGWRECRDAYHRFAFAQEWQA